jgi:hypothetical protein
MKHLTKFNEKSESISSRYIINYHYFLDFSTKYNSNRYLFN